MVQPEPYGVTGEPLKVVHETPHKVTMHLCSSPISMPTNLSFLLDLLHILLKVLLV
jgi:hypothetical protein